MGHWGQWFSTDSCGLLDRQPLVVCHHSLTNLLQLFSASPLSLNVLMPFVFQMCQNSLSFLCFIRSTAVLCHSTFSSVVDSIFSARFQFLAIVHFFGIDMDVCCRKDSKPPVPVTAQSVSPMMMVPTAHGYPGSVVQHGYMPAQQLVASQPMLQVSQRIIFSVVLVTRLSNCWGGNHGLARAKDFLWMTFNCWLLIQQI